LVKQTKKGTGIYQPQQPFAGIRSGQAQQFSQPNPPQFAQSTQYQNSYDSQQIKQRFVSPSTTSASTTTTNIPASMANQQQSECEIHFSGKHDALYIYLTRLLAPIWDLKLLTELTTNKNLSNDNLPDNNHAATLNEPYLFAIFTEIDIQWYLNKLNELRHFIDLQFPQLKTLQHSYLNSSLYGFTSSNVAQQSQLPPQGVGLKNQPRFATQFGSMPLNMTTLVNLTTAVHPPISEEKLAVEIENGSIFLVKQFLNRTIEIFGLWKILDEHKFHVISSKLDKQTIMLMLNMHIKTFLLSDDSLLEQLITALLYRYIDNNACTDSLNQSLKQMCPSLYTNENAIFSKACEKLKQALNIKNDNYERDQLLKEAVDLMKQIGYVANLTQVCDMLYLAGCYEAIFELCLTAAEKRDPQNIALYYYSKSEPPEDVQGQHYFSLRTECYKCMLDCLNSLIKMTPVTIQQHGMMQQPSHHRFINTKEKLEEQINNLIKYIVNSKDELAHVSLFNWMINSGLEKKLVTLESQFLENYLIREIRDQSKNRIYLDLLWRHYDYRKDYQNAAKVLLALAEKYR
jgi:nuclear pore complex protein Nup155